MPVSLPEANNREKQNVSHCQRPAQLADPCLYLNLIMNAGSAWLASAFKFYITIPFLRAVFVALLFI